MGGELSSDRLPTGEYEIFGWSIESSIDLEVIGSAYCFGRKGVVPEFV